MKQLPTIKYTEPEIVETEHKLPIELTDYYPTPGEMKILYAMMDDDAPNLSICQICDNAGVSTETYYRGFKKPGFKKLALDLALELIRMHALPLVRRAIKEANGGNFNYFKYLMEMGEIGKRVDATNTITIKFADPDSGDE